MTEPMLTYQALLVLKAMLDLQQDTFAGTEIKDTLDITTGTLYPLLRRLEGFGWLSSKWEVNDEKIGRPRRRYYKFTALGKKRTREVLSSLQVRTSNTFK